MKNRERGFTLVEMAIALALLSVLIVSVGSVTRSITDAVGSELIELEVQEVGESVTNVIGRDLAMSRLVGFQAAGEGAPVLTFVIPVDVGEDDNGNLVLDDGEDADGDEALDLTDGDFTAPDVTIQWGAVEEEGPRLDTPGTPHQSNLRYASLEDVNESDLGFDINRDGDQVDVFQRGSLRYTTSGGLNMEYGRGAILAVVADPAADLNNDGVPDPLFLMEGEAFVDSDGNGVYSSGESFTDGNGNGTWDGRIRLNVWVWKEINNGERFTLRNYSRTWELSDVGN